MKDKMLGVCNKILLKQERKKERKQKERTMEREEKVNFNKNLVADT